MTTHTQGKLTVHENGDANSYALRDDSGHWLIAMVIHNGEAMLAKQRANLRRIAACWNACEKVSTEDLEAMKREADASWIMTIDWLARQREAMRADLELAVKTLRSYEALHRAKGTEDSELKADVNAGLASRFEATLKATA